MLVMFADQAGPATEMLKDLSATILPFTTGCIGAVNASALYAGAVGARPPIGRWNAPRSGAGIHLDMKAGTVLVA
jgi:hypothetical protein